MKRTNKILLLIGGSLVGIFILFRIGTFRASNSDSIQLLNKVFVGNMIIVNTSSDLNLEKVKIAFSDKVVFEKGEFHNNIGEIYGGPNFDVYYGNNLIGRALHHNTSDWYVNEFIFNFFTDNNQIKFTFKTKGKNQGEEKYVWITKINDTLNFESFKSNGQLINKWKKQQPLTKAHMQ